MIFIFSLLAGLVIISSSAFGLLFARGKLHRSISKYHHHFLAFSSGVLFVIMISLVGEGLEKGLSPITNSLFFLIGAGSLVAVTYLFPNTHHHHDTQHDHIHTRLDGKHIMISDAIHNMSDGILIATTFNINIYLGIGTTAAIFIHELIRKTADFFVLVEASYSAKEAVMRNATTASTVLIGVVIGHFALATPVMEGYLSVVAAGAFAYVIFFDLLPCLVKHSRSFYTRGTYVALIIVGMSIMHSIGILLPHELATVTPPETLSPEQILLSE